MGNLFNKERLKIFGWYKRERTKLEKWYELNEKVRFGLVGFANMAMRYVFFVATGMIFSTLHYQIVLLLTWFLSSFIAFAAYKILVFNTVGNHVREYLKSIMIWSLSYLLNAGILEVLAGRLALNVYLAQAAAIAVIMVINYVLFKYFAFKQPKPQTRWEKILDFFNVFS